MTHGSLINKSLLSSSYRPTCYNWTRQKSSLIVYTANRIEAHNSYEGRLTACTSWELKFQLHEKVLQKPHQLILMNHDMGDRERSTRFPERNFMIMLARFECPNVIYMRQYKSSLSRPLLLSSLQPTSGNALLLFLPFLQLFWITEKMLC